MADHMVDRNTAGMHVALIPNGRGFGTMGSHHFGDDPIDFSGGLTHKNMWDDII